MKEDSPSSLCKLLAALLPPPKHRSIPHSWRMGPFAPAASLQTDGLVLDPQSKDSGRAATDTSRKMRPPRQKNSLAGGTG